MWVGIWAAALSLAFVCSANAQGSRRAGDDFYGRKYALVIGNGAYERSPLNNPTNDASDVADALKKIGFKVTLQVDATLAAMRLALAEFESKLPNDAAALLFYAGHGVQYQGLNYLIPIDAMNKVNVGLDLTKNALALTEVTQQLSSRRKGITIIVLDACRDSPFTDVQSIEGGLSRSTGLSGLRTSDGSTRKVGGLDGVMFAYSTAPNSTAADGSGRNSPYAKHFKELVRRPNASLETVLKLVRAEVTKETDGQQTPWYESSIDGDFFVAGRGRMEFDELINTLVKSDNAWHPQSEGQDVITWKDAKPVLNRTDKSEFKDGFNMPISYGFKRRGSVIITRDGNPVHFGDNDTKPEPWDVTLIGSRAGVDLISLRSGSRALSGGDGDIFESSVILSELSQCKRTTRRGAEEHRVFRIRDVDSWLYMKRLCGASSCSVEYFVIMSDFGLGQFGCADVSRR